MNFLESFILAFVGINFTLMLALFGFNTKRLNEMDKRLSEAPSRDEVDKTIDTKLELVKTLQKEIKEDIKDLKKDIHRLIEKSN